MRRLFTGFLLLSGATTAWAQEAAPAQKVQEMTIVTPFLAEQQLTPAFAKPLVWLDDASYLVFVEGEDGAAAGFDRVDARSGESRPMFERGRDRAAFLAMPGAREQAVTAALGDSDRYIWRDDHSGYVIDIADDLFSFTFDPDGGSGRAVRLTASPGEEVGVQFSPDGRLVGFVSDFNLYVVDAAGKTPPRPLTDGGHEDLFFGRLDWVYQEEVFGRGNFQGFWWSPDSTRIALFRLDESPVREFTLVSDEPVEAEVEVSNYPKAGAPNPVVDLGVIDTFGGAPRWFDLSRYAGIDTLIVGVTWHPSGDEVFFQVTDREQTWLEMLAGDPATGAVRRVFREESDCWINPGPEPIWLGDGTSFLWQSERDGNEHIYQYAVDGKLLRRLTSGDYDAEKIVAVDPGVETVYFESDRGDAKQMQLWRVGFDGADPVKVSQRPGWHAIIANPSATLYYDKFSALDYREAWSVHSIDGASLRSIVESDMAQLDPFALAAPEFHKVEARDGFELEAILIKPRDFEVGKRYPVLCHIYAGPHAPRALNRWRFRDYLWHHLLAQKGYLVWVLDNRSASGKGRKAARACYRDMGSSELRDHEDGVKWLVDNGYADPSRIGIWGWSYGGYQTCFNLTHSKTWKLGIAVNPVTDWKFYDTIYTERYMGMPQNNPDGYRRSSVLEAAANLHGDLLLVHATMDDNVHMQNSMALVHALQQANKPFRFMPYPRVRHGIGDLRQQIHLFRTMTDFVVEKL